MRVWLPIYAQKPQRYVSCPNLGSKRTPHVVLARTAVILNRQGYSVCSRHMPTFPVQELVITGKFVITFDYCSFSSSIHYPVAILLKILQVELKLTEGCQRSSIHLEIKITTKCNGKLCVFRFRVKHMCYNHNPSPM